MASKWTRRGQAERRGGTYRPRRRQRPDYVGYQVNLKNMRVTCNMTRASLPMQECYLACHTMVPKDIAQWSEAQLLEPLEQARAQGALSDWQRALILLAHHESELASSILGELLAEVPAELEDFWELAYAESVGWLGFDYLLDDDGRPQVVPAGMAIPEGQPC